MAAATSAPSAMANSAVSQEGGGGDVIDEEASDSLETDAAHEAAAAQDGVAAEEGSGGQAGSLRRR